MTNLFRWITRFIIICLLAGTLPVNLGAALNAQSGKKVKKVSSGKKRPVNKKTTKKRSGKKSSKSTVKSKSSKAAAYTKRGITKAKKKDFKGALKDFLRAYKLSPSKSNKKRIRQLQTILKKSGSKKSLAAAGKPGINTIKTPPILNTVDFVSEIYGITQAFEISSRNLLRATSYLEPPPGKKVTTLERRSKPSVQDLESMVRREPNDTRLQIDLARQYENQGQFEDAKYIYLRLVSQASYNPDFHFHLGSFYARFNQLNKARQSFDEALDYKPDHAATLDAMATLFGSEEKKLLSAEVLNRSAGLDPEGPARRISLIRSKLDEGEFNSALKLAISGQDLFPGHSSFIFLKGKAYDGSGNYRKAKSAFQESIKKDPEYVESYSALGDLYYSRGKYIYAALSYSDVVRLNPNDTESRFKQGLSYFKANEWGYAAAAWEDLLHYDPHHKNVRKYLPQAYYILAVEYNRLSESGLGQASFQKALSINRNSGAWLAGSMATLGQYYRENKMYRESLAAFQEVIELRPRDADAYLGLGITYWKLNEQKLARAAWQRSLELNPGNENNARGWMLLVNNKNSDS